MESRVIRHPKEISISYGLTSSLTYDSQLVSNILLMDLYPHDFHVGSDLCENYKNHISKLIDAVSVQMLTSRVDIIALSGPLRSTKDDLRAFLLTGLNITPNAVILAFRHLVFAT